jgi:hypothetical protein
MTDAHRKAPPGIGDAALWASLVALIVMCFCAGCASSMDDPCAGCPPRLDTQIVDKPIPCVIELGSLGDIELPSWPRYPGHDASDEELDFWLSYLKSTQEKRESLLLARVKAEDKRIAVHDLQEPKCSDVTNVTP